LAYQALYRKFRPHEFEDVKGQDAIIKTLKNQIIYDRIGHAYLFCGTRGTGKTSVAKIFAKAVNCANPIDGSPCGVCECCKEIEAGNSMNVIEIDAASNNGVDNIREIRDEVAYRPTKGNYKVYIIDEVHMLSNGAFNALLKTLEEPPEYVIFILATTEAHKIPVTIASRCQRYDFKRISIEVLEKRLQELITKEGYEVEDKAINYLARAADGALRDAISLLDQCIAFHLGEVLTYEHVLDVLGAIETDVFGKLFREIQDKDVNALMDTVEELMLQGKEISQLCIDFTWYLRSMLLVKSTASMNVVLGVTEEAYAVMKEDANLISADELIRYIRVLSDLINELRFTSQKRIMLEVTLIRLATAENEGNQGRSIATSNAPQQNSVDVPFEEDNATRNNAPNIEFQVEQLVKQQIRKMKSSGDLIDRVELENELRERDAFEGNAGGDVVRKSKPKPVLPRALSEDIATVAKEYRRVIDHAEMPLKSYLQKTNLSVGENDLLFVVADEEMTYEFLKSGEHLDRLHTLIEKYIGKKIELKLKTLDKGGRFEDTYVDIEKLVSANINFPVEQE
jgi:DNA polymerase-3 subunit gamma/tau